MFYFDTIIQPTATALLIAHAAYVLGRMITKHFSSTQQISALSVGLSLLLGYGLFAYLALLLSLFPPITVSEVWTFAAALMIGGYKMIAGLYVYARNLLFSLKYRHRSEKILIIVIFLGGLFYATSAYVPQYRVDALAYHIPEAIQIAQKGILSLGGEGNFFGNLPVLVETLYAPLYILSGHNAMNLTHFFILLAGAAALYGFVRRRFGPLPALVSFISIFSIYELLVNATSAYVDAATVSFEIMAILFFIEWVLNQKREYLFFVGALYGLALSTKYLPLYSLAVIAFVFVGVHLFKKIPFRQFLVNSICIASPVMVFAGFWYIKNAIRFGNPVYPFLFGHPGFADATIESINVATKQFGDRGIWPLIKLPFTHFLHPLYLHVLASFFILLTVFVIKKEKIFLRSLAVGVTVYFVVWFFAISHQRRFAMSAIVLLLLYVSILLGQLIESRKKILEHKLVPYICIVLVAGVSLGLYAFRDTYYVAAKTAELAYVAGIDSEQAFYEKRVMGPVFNVSSFVNEKNDGQRIFNTALDPEFFLRNGNVFVHPQAFIQSTTNITTTTLVDYLNRDTISYINAQTKQARDAYLASDFFKQNPAEQDYYEDVLKYVIEIETLLPSIADPIYSAHDRILFRLK